MVIFALLREMSTQTGDRLLWAEGRLQSDITDWHFQGGLLIYSLKYISDVVLFTNTNNSEDLFFIKVPFTKEFSRGWKLEKYEKIHCFGNTAPGLQV